MREIKFRYYFENMRYGGLCKDTFTLKDVEDGLVLDEDNYDNLELSVFKRVQFTGLKDKNGVEIYESDLIKFTTERDLFEVKWSEVYLAYHIYSRHKRALMSLCECENFEVIGNIYENKDLLNEN